MRSNNIINVFIVLMGISPAIALGEGNKNLLLIGAMCLSPYFLIKYPLIIPKIDFPLITVCFMMVCFPLVFHPETMRWSTILYSILFCLNFMAFIRILIFHHYTSSDFINIIRWLLFAYCIVLVIQQFCVIANLPIFNISNYNPREPFKLNSLMAEPSHTARVLILLMFMYLLLYERITGITDIKKIFSNIDKKVLIAFLYPIITMGSGTAFLLLFVLIIRFIPKQRILNLIVYAMLLCPILYFVVKNVPSANRTIEFATALLQFDEENLIQKDLSAAIRIIPTIHGAKAVSIFSKDGLWGQGVDADEGLTPLPSVDCGAGAFSIWYNFGFFTALLFWAFTFYVCFLRRDVTMSILFWFLLCFFYGGLNNQLIWFTLALFITYKFTENENGDPARILG